jgi:hypothetical protein
MAYPAYVHRIPTNSLRDKQTVRFYKNLHSIMKRYILLTLAGVCLVSIKLQAQIPSAAQQVAFERIETLVIDSLNTEGKRVVKGSAFIPMQKDYFVGLQAIYNLLDDGAITPQAQVVASLWKNIFSNRNTDSTGLFWNVMAITNAGSLSSKVASTAIDTTKTLLRKIMTSGEGLTFDLYFADIRIKPAARSGWTFNPLAALNFATRSFSDTLQKYTFSVSKGGFTVGFGLSFPNWDISQDKSPMASLTYRYSWILNQDNFKRAYLTAIDDSHPSSIGYFNAQFVGPVLPQIGVLVDGKIGSFVPQWSIGLPFYK